MSSSTTKPAADASDVEQQLAALAKTGNAADRERAIAQLFHLYYDRLVRLAKSRGHASQAEDFIMDAWIKLIPGVRSGKYELKYELVYTAVLNKLRDEVQTARHRKTGRMTEEPLDRRGVSLDSQFNSESNTAKFNDCMAKLLKRNADWSEVLRRCLIPQEVTTIREELGLKDNQAVYNHKKYAVEFMRDCVQGGVE